ncbi:MAG: 16S rRNA (cytosine(1402)-N(4))-methyltransferase [Desulfobulbus propionicus]|nr:MAG: 16S rRNA (cytosine(1402)-N(4))-methyltransferase [Desulfobulbus propionicus]
MATEMVDLLSPQGGGIYVDATLGLGGHGEEILRRSVPDGRLIGFEWDGEAAALAQQRLRPYGERFQLVEASYAGLVQELTSRGLTRVDGIIADLGVSSLQLDRGDRGFSFMTDGPLDMRMNPALGLSAADLVAAATEEELADLFYHYGEERQARRIARFVVEAREVSAITTTGQLVDIVRRAVPRKFYPKNVHVATRVFQALRIAVNRELENVQQLLRDAPLVLRSGGRLCVLSFHSLEDRMVKQAFSRDPAYSVLTRRPLVPSAAELAANPRARSAKLRGAVISQKHQMEQGGNR